MRDFRDITPRKIEDYLYFYRVIANAISKNKDRMVKVSLCPTCENPYQFKIKDLDDMPCSDQADLLLYGVDLIFEEEKCICSYKLGGYSKFMIIDHFNKCFLDKETKTFKPEWTNFILSKQESKDHE